MKYFIKRSDKKMFSKDLIWTHNINNVMEFDTVKDALHYARSRGFKGYVIVPFKII